MFGKTLRNLRKEKNYSMDRFIELYNARYNTKMNKSTLSRYENGLQVPIYTVVVNIANFFGVSVDYLTETNKAQTEELKSRLEQAMSKMNMRAVELSKKTNIPKSSISQYISGYAKPNCERVYLLSKALDVSEAWLMGFDVPMERSCLDSSHRKSSKKKMELLKRIEKMTDEQLDLLERLLFVIETK